VLRVPQLDVIHGIGKNIPPAARSPSGSVPTVAMNLCLNLKTAKALGIDLPPYDGRTYPTG
jgi:hypothetical protein